jgi:hypothetical protein
MNSFPSLPRSVRLLGVLSASAVVACHNLDGFDTKPGYAYCGSIPDLPVFQDGFVPAGKPPSLELALTLDTSKLSGQPGILSSNDAGTGLCGTQPLFQDAPIRAITEVDYDALSTLSFGEGHEHDFFVWVDSTCQGTMLGVVSLMKNNQVELRLFKPAHLPPPDTVPTPGQKPGFAVFHLALEARAVPGQISKDGCTF